MADKRSRGEPRRSAKNEQSVNKGADKKRPQTNLRSGRRIYPALPWTFRRIHILDIQ